VCLIRSCVLCEQVYTAEECAARVSVMLGQYTGLVETECLCMVEMIRQHVLPAVRTAGMTQYVEQLDDAIALLQVSVHFAAPHSRRRLVELIRGGIDNGNEAAA
jgi:glutamine synthetase type III